MGEKLIVVFGDKWATSGPNQQEVRFLVAPDTLNLAEAVKSFYEDETAEDLDFHLIFHHRCREPDNRDCFEFSVTNIVTNEIRG